MNRFFVADQRRQTAFQPRCIVVLNESERRRSRLFPCAGEVRRKRLLVFSQETYREALGLRQESDLSYVCLQETWLHRTLTSKLHVAKDLAS